MRELPILMNGPMVRAVLEGRKTVTRRICRDQPHVSAGTDGVAWPDGKGTDTITWGGAPGCYLDRSPYHVGDLLWVRETFLREPHPSDLGMTREMIPHIWDMACAAAGTIHFRADESHDWVADGRRWTPSIHMPRWASRITLEVIGVRVELLQSISDEQCIAEGIERDQTYPTLWRRGRLEGDQNTVNVTGFPKLAFRSIWEAINGPANWKANPWVWVVEFKRIEQERKAA